MTWTSRGKPAFRKSPDSAWPLRRADEPTPEKTTQPN